MGGRGTLVNLPWTGHLPVRLHNPNVFISEKQLVVRFFANDWLTHRTKTDAHKPPGQMLSC